MALAPTNRHGQRLRRRYGRLREHLFTFLDHPDVTADNNGSERELRPTATYRKVTGGFRSDWGADLYAAVRSVIGTAARRGIGAFQAIRTARCRTSGGKRFEVLFIMAPPSQGSEPPPNPVRFTPRKQLHPESTQAIAVARACASRSYRSRFMTLFQAATKSRANFPFASSLA